jgi:hypothetical protein
MKYTCCLVLKTEECYDKSAKDVKSLNLHTVLYRSVKVVLAPCYHFCPSYVKIGSVEAICYLEV